MVSRGSSDPLFAAGALTSEAAQELSALDVDLKESLDDLGAAVAAYLHDFGGTGRSTELRPTLVRGRPLFRRPRAVVRAAALLGVLQARLIDARPYGDDPRCAAAHQRGSTV